MFFFAKEEAVVAAVGFPGDVEDVAGYGNGAYGGFEKDVGEHANQSDEWCAASPGGEDDEAGGDAGEGVADTGDPAD